MDVTIVTYLEIVINVELLFQVILSLSIVLREKINSLTYLPTNQSTSFLSTLPKRTSNPRDYIGKELFWAQTFLTPSLPG